MYFIYLYYLEIKNKIKSIQTHLKKINCDIIILIIYKTNENILFIRFHEYKYSN